MLVYDGHHEIKFYATEKKHRYIIETHGCNREAGCVAAYKKGKS